MMAVQVGGLHVLNGMLIMSGLSEMIFSRIMTRLRSLFPVEVTGVVVTFVGISVLPIAYPKFCGIDDETGLFSLVNLGIGLVTLAIMIGLNVFSKGKIKLYCVLIGLICGYIISAILGVLTVADLMQIIDAPVLGLPDLSYFGFDFNFTLVAPFLIAMTCSTLKSVGDITICQRINDLDWKRPDMKNVRDGIFVDGLGDVISGILGTFGTSTSSSNIGLSLGTGATSRYIAYAMGIILIILACFPKLAMIFVIMPAPVMGAALMYAVSFMVVTGLQVLNSRMMDIRKTFVVGLSFLIGLSALMPDIYTHVPELLQPVFASTLSLATITVIFLNLIFRIGVKSKETITVQTGASVSDTISDFMKMQGGAWGARPDIITRASSAIHEAIEAISLVNPALREVSVQVSFDEFNLDSDISYSGDAIPIMDQRPSDTEIIDDETAMIRLSGYMLKRYTDRISSTKEGDLAHVLIHFEH
jgi:NCS2 family nucleobase:cation symporter-2